MNGFLGICLLVCVGATGDAVIHGEGGGAQCAKGRVMVQFTCVCVCGGRGGMEVGEDWHQRVSVRMLVSVCVGGGGGRGGKGQGCHCFRKMANLFENMVLFKTNLRISKFV